MVTPDEARVLGLGRIKGLENHIREGRNGRDLTQKPRGVMVIDLLGLGADKVRDKYPEVYQGVVERVKPERDQNNRKAYRDNWWVIGEPKAVFRPALKGLTRYISTVETSKHRFFVFLDQSVLPDNMLVNIALGDAYYLGVLSSRLHVAWALAQGGTLEDRPRYNKTCCFETFPFPNPPQPLISRIRDLGERLDAHRKRQQELHPDLTMTNMCNVLTKLKTGEPLSDIEREVHDQGLVSVLKEIHDKLDAAGFEAYGWPPDLGDAEILERLVALNHERAAEEANGLVRWLRPEYQAPDTGPVQPEMIKGDRKPAPKAAAPSEVEDVAGAFSRAPRKKVAELLDTLAGLGQARALPDGRYLAN